MRQPLTLVISTENYGSVYLFKVVVGHSDEACGMFWWGSGTICEDATMSLLRGSAAAGNLKVCPLRNRLNRRAKQILTS